MLARLLTLQHIYIYIDIHLYPKTELPHYPRESCPTIHVDFALQIKVFGAFVRLRGDLCKFRNYVCCGNVVPPNASGGYEKWQKWPIIDRAGGYGF